MGAAGDGGTTAEAGAGGGGTGGASSVQETLSEIYAERIQIAPRYVGAALVVLGGWWLLFGAFSAFVAGMGLLILTMGLDNVALLLASRQWSTTDGAIAESTVLTQRELRDSFAGIGRSSSTKSGYVPLVRYEYTVDGEYYVNVRISPFDGRIGRRRRAESIVETYARNDQVSVRYDPDDPSRSFIRLWMPATWVFVWILGTIGLLGTALLIALGPSLASRITVDVPEYLPFVLFGGVFIVIGLYHFLGGLLTYRWPSTTGVVRAREVKRRSGGERSSTSYVPKLRYEYTVDGDTYVSSRIAVGSGPSFSSRSRAEGWLEDYPIDEEVTIYYSPRRPDKSVVARGGILQGLALVVIVGILLTVVFFLATGRPVPGWLPIDRLLELLPI